MEYCQKFIDAFDPVELKVIERMTAVEGLYGTLVEEDNELNSLEATCEGELAKWHYLQKRELREIKEGNLSPRLKKRKVALKEAISKNLANLKAFRKCFPLELRDGCSISKLGIVQFYPMFNYEECPDFGRNNPSNYFRSNPFFIYLTIQEIESDAASNPTDDFNLMWLVKENFDSYLYGARLLVNAYAVKH